MKAIIVDDEKKGREILLKLIESYCKDVEIVGMAADAAQAYSLIEESEPDVVFLDIEMPNGNGFTLLERFEKINFQVIFTTAYDGYALKAIKFHALDYLLKPIDIDDLTIAVEKARKKMSDKSNLNERYQEFIYNKTYEYGSKITLPIKEGVVFVAVSDIIRIESDSSYSEIFTIDGNRYITSRNIKEYEEILPPRNFFRVHKSHLINVNRVRKYLKTDGHFVEMENGDVIEIARRKKDEFLLLMS